MDRALEDTALTLFFPSRARVGSDLNSGRETRVVSSSQRGSEHA